LKAASEYKMDKGVPDMSAGDSEGMISSPSKENINVSPDDL